jgi:hypothetical protein
MPTASGLLDSGSRQMNVDLVREVTGGFEFIEVKVVSNTPFEAAMQVLRYGAVYILYRNQHELMARFRSHPVLAARQVALRVLAPRAYYDKSKCNLPALEQQLNQQTLDFSRNHCHDLELTFEFSAFPWWFDYRPGGDSAVIKAAVNERASPFKTD